MREVIQVLIIAFLLISVIVVEAQVVRPNILFIMSDDHTTQAVGAYGSRLQKLNPTPAIDKLAEEGIIMQNAFCTNSICTPSRACIMTGQYSGANGVLTLAEALDISNQHLAIEMKKAGYQTAVVGKWHLHNAPEEFDYYKVLFGQGKYFDPYFRVRNGTETFIQKNLSGEKTDNNAVQMKGHTTDCITESALDWLKNKRNPNQSFFLKLHFKAPHARFHYAPRYEDYLKDVDIPEPESLYEQGNHGSLATRGQNDELLRYMGGSVSLRNKSNKFGELDKIDPDISNEEYTKRAYQEYLKKYLRCVKGVDDNIKRVLEYLEAEDLMDNTVIIYTGDQGFYLGEHDYVDKRWGYEEGMRMPFIVRYPEAIKAGSKSDAIIENVDYPAMMLDYAGVPTPDYMHDRSFRSIMETGKEPENWKHAAYYHYWMHMAANIPAHIGIRTKEFKLLFFYGCTENEAVPETPPAWELYDLENDPMEMNNIYDNPNYAGVIKELKTELKKMRREYEEDHPKYACNLVIDEFWDYGPEERTRAIEISEEYLRERQKAE